jgi:hypothetical protein
MRSHCLTLAVVVLAGLSRAPEAAAQGMLAQAAERAQRDWLEHDMGGLVSGADTVRLQLPGLTQSATVGPAQAARLLERHVQATREVSFDLVSVRPAGKDRGYAEGRRHYVVSGTAEERQETVFLGFEQIGGQWCVREVRIVP